MYEYEDALDITQACKNVLESMKEAGERGFAALEEFSRAIATVEDELGSKYTTKVPFSKIINEIDGSEWTISVKQQEDTEEKKFRIYLTITNYGPKLERFHRPIRQCKIEERMKCMRFFESFMDSYHEHYVKYINTLCGEADDNR